MYHILKFKISKTSVNFKRKITRTVSIFIYFKINNFYTYTLTFQEIYFQRNTCCRYLITHNYRSKRKQNIWEGSSHQQIQYQLPSSMRLIIRLNIPKEYKDQCLVYKYQINIENIVPGIYYVKSWLKSYHPHFFLENMEILYIFPGNWQFLLRVRQLDIEIISTYEKRLVIIDEYVRKTDRRS